MAGRPTVGSILKRTVALRRYENQLAAEVGAIVRRTSDTLAELIAGQDLTAVSAGRVQARLDSIATKADEVLLRAFQDINALTRERLVDLGQVGTKATAAELRRAAAKVGVDLTQIGLPTRGQLRAIISSDPVRGEVMGKWWVQQRKTTKAAFRREIQLGLSRQENLDQLVRRIRGRSVGNGRYEGGVMEVTRRNAESLARTAVNQVYNAATQATYEENPDIVQEWEFLATLDDRTTPECAALDGKVFKIREGPVPPRHWGCRSTTIPVINYRGLGVKKPKEEPRQTYGEWFKGQPAADQDDILGPGRAALVRSGKADLEDLVRRDGSKFTLKQLTAKLED